MASPCATMSRLLDRRAFRPRAPRRGRRLPPRAPVASGAETSTSAPPIPFKAPPRTCTSAASEARAVLRALREGATSGDASVPRRVRVELPLPPADRDTDDLVYLGLHGQAADWSGGMQQRFRVTKGYVEDAMLDGYDHEYLGLLDRDADGMGVWRVGENMTAVAHPSDVTVGFFLRLLRGEYGDAVLDPSHVVVVVNAFWSGNGERVGQPWEFGLKREARRCSGATAIGIRCTVVAARGPPRAPRARSFDRGPGRGDCTTRGERGWCWRRRRNRVTGRWGRR